MSSETIKVLHEKSTEIRKSIVKASYANIAVMVANFITLIWIILEVTMKDVEEWYFPAVAAINILNFISIALDFASIMNNKPRLMVAYFYINTCWLGTLGVVLVWIFYSCK